MDMTKKTGKVCFYRPKRSRPRLFTPQKLTDIYQRVCSEYSPQAAKRAVQEASCYQQTEADCEKVMANVLSVLVAAAAAYAAIGVLAELLQIEALALLLRRLPAGISLQRALNVLNAERIAQQKIEIDRVITQVERILGKFPE